ncbi:hypothetical protein F5148DRAFT_1292476 [Russula earlei]|uniref:Uncharacterized protein n=1 Tax=Russula earlei TaxID=71964 RepID=A0ACC0TT75_9AGAM|nr:hypothetical protein F5148DRAFT_1292476 [Russula earlei]
MTKQPGYHDSVFLNCPFDDEYKPILRAILYTVYRCGFFPKTALDEDDGTDYRLNKIIRKISDCKYGIHDLSRIEVNINGYPRFNMPFELGIFFGAKHLGNTKQRAKNALVLEPAKYAAQQLISDLNGIDPQAHNNNPENAMRQVRNWLRTASGRTTIPGPEILNRQYHEFNKGLPAVAHALGFRVDEINYTDLVNVIEDVVSEQLNRTP